MMPARALARDEERVGPPGRRRRQGGGPVTQSFGRRRGFVYLSSPRPPEDDWIAVVAESFVALIEAGPGERGIEALAELAFSEDTTLERVVSSVPHGRDGVDSFAVVHVDSDDADGWQATAIVRGRAVIDAYSVGGARRFSSSGVQPWLITTFRDVVAVELGGPTLRLDAVLHRTPTALPIGLGTAHAGSLLWSVGATERTGGGSDGAGPGFARPGAAPDDDTVLRIRVGDGSAVPGAAAHVTPTQPDTASPRPSGVDDDTVVRRRSRPGHGTAAEAPGAAGGDRRELDERTMDRASVPRPPQDADGDGAPPDVLVGIRGRASAALDAPVVFGRRPSRSRRSGAEPVLVAVDSPRREISASHVRIERVGRVVVVTDLNSRNGTVVAVEGRPSRRLRPGESVAVPAAAAVEIGDGTIIDITPVWLTS